ncbi:VirB4 family type IV secretion system protein [Metabacillus fastidiosus]|uniref:VirB4 family type IV secretion system protein n=1 Tax=Metabacillus fastidiosus TaxID=1458 RepID=UPI003D2AA05A
MKNIFRKKKKVKSPEPVRDEKELIFPTLIDNALNDGITFYDDYFKIQTGLGMIKYGRTFFIKPSGYPRTVRINWLEGLFSGDDMDVSVHIEPFHRTEAQRKLKKKIDQLETVFYSASRGDNTARIEETLQKLQDTKGLRDQIRNNQNGLYYVSIQATVFADSLTELNQKCVDVETNVAGESIELINAYGRQKEGFLSNIPLGRNYLSRASRNLDQLSLTAIFPHTSSKLNHTGGMPIGVYGNEYVYYNNFDQKLNNYNVGVFGESGAGKGVFVKQIIGRGFMDGINKVVIFDVEPEYTDLTMALGGAVIVLRSDSYKGKTSRINPLDVYAEKEIFNKNQPDEFVVERVNLNEKVKEVIEFFKVMKESASGQIGAALTPTELGILDETLNKLYSDKGITEDPNSIYQKFEEIDENGELTWQRKYTEMPTISDVYEELVKQKENSVPGLEELLSVISLFRRGRAFGMFDGQTELISDFDMDLETAPIINFDISRLSSNGIERPLAQHVLMTWTWNRFIKNDPKSKKRIVQDEAWMMLKYPSMMDFFKLLSARGRKWNVSLTLISQRYEMFHRTEEAQDVIAQLNTVAFLKQSDQDIEPILETFRFSDEVGQMIRTADTGDVILKAGKEIVAFRSEPTPSEWTYLNTNQNVKMSG